jgi:hypothetical protein
LLVVDGTEDSKLRGSQVLHFSAQAFFTFDVFRGMTIASTRVETMTFCHCRA